MIRLIMLAILLSSCQTYEHVGSSADAAGGVSGRLHLAVENNKVVLKRQKLNATGMQITQHTALPLTNNDNVRKLGAVFLDIGSGDNSVANLRFSKLQLSYTQAGKIINCNFNNISLGSTLPANACTGDSAGVAKRGGWTNTSSSSKQGQDMQQRIVSAAFDLSVVDKMGMNLLHYAATRKENAKAIQFFLDQNIYDINAVNIIGNTPLHLATKYGDEEGVKILLQVPNINKTLRNHDGQTAYDIAIKNSMWEVAPLLK